MTARVAMFVIGLTLAGCATAPPPDVPPSGEQWRRATGDLERLRREFAPSPGIMRVSVRFAWGGEELELDARGAVARRPPRDLRMILIGPGGVTAFDLLIRDRSWRVVMPDRPAMTGTVDHSQRGLPVGFLRWWLLEPLSGKLLAVKQTLEGPLFVLRDGDSTVRVQRRGEGLVMERRSPSGTERMEVTAPGCAQAVYQHVDAKVRAAVRCESVTGGATAVEDRMFE